jgi:hypothetical protein
MFILFLILFDSCHSSRRFAATPRVVAVFRRCYVSAMEEPRESGGRWLLD